MTLLFQPTLERVEGLPVSPIMYRNNEDSNPLFESQLGDVAFLLCTLLWGWSDADIQSLPRECGCDRVTMAFS
jgi:hypothetical protein